MTFHFMRISAAVGMAVLLSACGPSAGPGAKPSVAAAPVPARVAPVKPTPAVEIGPNTYRSDGLGLTVTAPDGWYVAPVQQMTKMMEVGTDITTSNMNSGTKAAVNNSISRTASIFTFMQQAPGAPVEYTPSIMALTEDVSMFPGTKRGTDYFFQARRLMEQSPIPTVISDTYSERAIGGQSFDRMDVEMGPPGRSVAQRYFAARHGDTMFMMIQVYRTDEELATLDKVLDSIKLDW